MKLTPDKKYHKAIKNLVKCGKEVQKYVAPELNNTSSSPKPTPSKKMKKAFGDLREAEQVEEKAREEYLLWLKSQRA